MYRVGLGPYWGFWGVIWVVSVRFRPLILGYFYKNIFNFPKNN